jgi:hypothetical protein
MPDNLDRLYPKLSRGRYCYICGKPAENIHHVIPRSNILLRYDIKNLLPLCCNCHNEVHDKNLDLSSYIGLSRYSYLEYMKNINFKDYLLQNNLTKEEFFKQKEKELKEEICNA